MQFLIDKHSHNVLFKLWYEQRGKRLYVNSWGRGKKGKIESRVGEKAPARFLSIAEADHSEELIFHTISQ